MPSPVHPIRPPSTIEPMIDEYGDIDLKLQHLAPEMARHKILKEMFQLAGEDAPADMPCVLHGRRWSIQLTPRENQRRIFDARKAFGALKKAVGLEGLIALIKIPLEAGIDKHVAKDEHKLFLVQERTGARTMKAVPIAPPPAAA